MRTDEIEGYYTTAGRELRALPKPGSTFAGYQLLRAFPSGCTGATYLARGATAGGLHVLKILPFDAGTTSAFHESLRELALLLPGIRHRYSARIERVAAHEGLFYIVSEYFGGETDRVPTLEDMIAENPHGIGTNETALIAGQICSALAHLHERRTHLPPKHLLHMNLKPRNVMITRSNDTGAIECKLCDIGVMHLLDPARIPRLIQAWNDPRWRIPPEMKHHWKQEDCHLALLESYKHMSPEILAMCHLETLDERCDIYSLGVIIHRMLTGRYPSRPVTEDDLSALPQGTWRNIVLTCLAVSPGERFRNCRELAVNLPKATSLVTIEPLVKEHASRPESSHPVALGIDACQYPEDLARHVRHFAQKPLPSSADRFVNRIGMEFVRVPSGISLIGSPEHENERHEDERLHFVEITKDYHLQATAVTQAQWYEIMRTRPWMERRYTNLFRIVMREYVEIGPDYPAVYVSWDDAMKFINRLNRRERTGLYRLPTEAEWEHACRFGSFSPFYWGEAIDEDYCTYIENCWEAGIRHALEVAGKMPNSLGLHDMSGNVWEWCSDWYGEYPLFPALDPTGPQRGERHVLRGGSWYSTPRYCRSANRFRPDPTELSPNVGFRILREIRD